MFIFIFCTIFISELHTQSSFSDNKNFTLLNSNSDEFDGTTINTTRWNVLNYLRTEYGVERTNITSRIQNVEIANGALLLKCKYEHIPNTPSSYIFTGGEILSNASYTNNVFFESVFRLPSTQYTVSGIWLFAGDVYKGPNTVCNWREFDFLEWRPNSANPGSTGSINYCSNLTATSNSEIDGGFGYIINNPSSQDHMVQARWSKYMSIYLDNVEMRKRLNPQTPFFNTSKGLYINNWVHNVNPNPSQAEIDEINNSIMTVRYLRVYTLAMHCDLDIPVISNFNTFTWGLKRSYTLSNTTAIPVGIKINLMATDYIHFDPGFEVPLGTELEAWMIECD